MNSDKMHAGVTQWQKWWLRKKEYQDLLSAAMNMLLPKKGTNLFLVLQLGCILSVTYSECGKSFSVLGRHYTWLRVRMAITKL